MSKDRTRCSAASPKMMAVQGWQQSLDFGEQKTAAVETGH
jgi:hypothetical protein